MEITMRIAGEDAAIRALDVVAGHAGDLRRPLADMGERLVRRIAKRLSGAVLKENTGRLKGSLMHKETTDTLEVSAGGGKQVDYAAIHHFGGVIRPKKKKFLTIPFPGGPADKPVPLRAADFEDTFVAKGIIFQRKKKGKGVRIIPVFILKKSVTMPARPYMYVEDPDVEYLTESISDFIAGAWK
jgi:phage gpG-like protein